MHSSLSVLRQAAPQVTPEQFVGWNPGCMTQSADDATAGDFSPGLTGAGDGPEAAATVRRERSGVRFSVQMFRRTLGRRRLVQFRGLGVAIDLVTPLERGHLSTTQVDARKDAYIVSRLRPFPLRPHWLIETRTGFHAVFRIRPVREPLQVTEAASINLRLIRALGGTVPADPVIQCLRVPGTEEWTDRGDPFRCRLLLNFAPVFPPYALGRVRAVLDDGEAAGAAPRPPPAPGDERTGMRNSGHEDRGLDDDGGILSIAVVAGDLLRQVVEALHASLRVGRCGERNAQIPSPRPGRELRLWNDSGRLRTGGPSRVVASGPGVKTASPTSTANSRTPRPAGC